MTTRWELLCSRDLALRLGAILPRSTVQHRVLLLAHAILMRDAHTGEALFWLRVPEPVTTRGASS